MKTIVPRQQLQECLSAVATLIGGRTTKPILSCVKLTAGGDEVSLEATDSETSLRLATPALSVARVGSVVAPAERLLSIVREMSDVELQLESDERHLTIRGEGNEFRIFTAAEADFPPIAALAEEPDLAVAGRLLKRMIHLTLYAAAREMSRYAINGVQWEKRGKRLFMIATDGRRLARAGGDVLESRAADFEAIVPTKALAVLEKVFTPPRDDEDWSIELKVLPNQILIRSGDRTLSTVLVEGQFPKYQEVIPISNDKVVRLDREEFFGAVRRAALLTTDDARAVRLSFQADRLVITSQSPERGDARVQMGVEYGGPPIEIGFNPAFLSDALARMTDCRIVEIELLDNFKPGVLSGGDKDEFLYVVMPVSLSG